MLRRVPRVLEQEELASRPRLTAQRRTPLQQAVRDTLIAFMAATAQANAEAIQEAQRGGIGLAKATAGEVKYRERKPTFDKDQLEPCAACSSNRRASDGSPQRRV